MPTINKKRKGITAAELMSQLGSTSAFADRLAALRLGRALAQRVAEQAAEPLIAELKSCGLDVVSLSSLSPAIVANSAALAVLVKWLQLTAEPSVKACLVQALATPLARPYAAVLFAEFRKADAATFSSLKWAIGDCLRVVVDETSFAAVRELVLDERQGRAREMLVLALGQMRAAEAGALLVELLDDPQLHGHAVVGLGDFGDYSLRPALEVFLHHPKTWVRKEARKAVRKLDRCRAKAGERKGAGK